MDLSKILRISAAGMKAQSARMRIVAENMANSNAPPDRPGADPYRRKIVSFRSELDRQVGADIVKVSRITTDSAPFGRRYEPGHPGAGEDGYIKTSNVKSLVEMMDMREAQRSYEANLSVIKVSRTMIQNALGVLSN